MSSPHKKLYGPKEILLIVGSMLAGLSFFLFRQFHENGSIGRVEVIATIGTLFITTLITVFIVRKGNQQE